MSNVFLASARVGLTNAYHPQVIRNQETNLDSRVVDMLVDEKYRCGGVTPTTIMEASALGGSLVAQPLGFAGIQEGWGTSKGIMMLTLCTDQNPILEKYTKIIGYISNNSAQDGLSSDAIFTPVFSWQESKTITASLGVDPTQIKQEFGGFNDYMTLNPEQMISSAVTLRPNDVMSSGMGEIITQQLADQAENVGLDLGNNNIGLAPSVNAGQQLTVLGLISSRRQNINPTMYSAEILNQSINISQDMGINNRLDTQGIFEQNNTGVNCDGFVKSAHNLAQKEASPSRDEFLRTMLHGLGWGTLAGFTGFTINDMAYVFPNLNDVLDLNLYNSGFQVNDYTQDTMGMGTSNYAEIVSSAITFNLMDVMLRNGISAINITGSNCDSFFDGNVVMFPSNPATLIENDPYIAQRITSFMETLDGQVFRHLQGVDKNSKCPIRFSIESQLFGETVVRTTIVNENNINTAGMFEQTRVFPTYCLTTFSPILGDMNTSMTAGRNVVSNIQSYFKGI